MAERAPKKEPTRAPTTKQPRIEPVPDQEASGSDHTVPTCTVGFCPICLAVTAVQPMAPDVLRHLMNAGRELLLAAGSVLDARAEAVADGAARRTKLEKIDIG